MNAPIMKPDDPRRKLLFTPAEVTTAYIDYAKRLKSFPGIRWGVKKIDDVIIPMRPGDLVGIIARPGHGKSTVAGYLCRYTAKDIIARNTIDTECVVYVTLEQIIEEIECFFQVDGSYTSTDFAFGRVGIDVVMRAAMKRPLQPIWLIGRSMANRGKIAKMTMENIYAAITSIEEISSSNRDDGQTIKPVLVVIDYIQILPAEFKRKRWEQVEEAAILSKELGARIGAPVVLCVQARRDVDDTRTKIPTLSDAQHSSGIEQNVDKLFGVMRPCLYPGAWGNENKVSVNGQLYEITDNLMVMQCLKQRFAPAGQRWALHFAPEYIQLEAMASRADYDF